MNDQTDAAAKPASEANPAWAFATLTIAFVLYGLSQDVMSRLGSNLLLTAFFVLLFAPYVVQRIRRGRWFTPWPEQPRLDVTLVALAAVVIGVLLTIGFAGPIWLAGLGVPLPWTVSWTVIALIILAGLPLSRWDARRGERSDGE